jgi:predicted DNA-binding transcriptional regulator YafY
MGRKSSTVTAIQILAAFLEKRRWSQRALAMHAGIAVKRLRMHLTTLRTEHHWPLTQTGEKNEPWWELPAGWGPGGVLVPQALAPDLVRLLVHARRGKARDRLLERLEVSAHGPDAERVVAEPPNTREEEFLSIVHQAARDGVPLRIRYGTVNDGLEKTRDVSIQRLLVDGGRARLLAVCHRTGELRFFRVDRVASARLEPHETFRSAAEDDIRRKLDESFGGMHEGEPAQDLWFFVRNPAARWVADSLPKGMTSEPTAGGIRVSVHTSSPRTVARYVVGLGKHAVPEHEALRKVVRRLALEALESCDEAEHEDREKRAVDRGTPPS